MSAAPRIRRVLVCDDNLADAYLVREAFAECGPECELVLVNAREEASRLASSENFDLMLSDFGTDSLSAEQFLRDVKASKPYLPIVVFSAVHDPTPAYRAGVNAFVRKTSDLDLFFTKVRRLIQFWTEVAELPGIG
jgi:CheY-like chemotaxis protein